MLLTMKTDQTLTPINLVRIVTLNGGDLKRTDTTQDKWREHLPVIEDMLKTPGTRVVIESIAP